MSVPRSAFDEERDGYVYGLMRLLLGVLLVVQTLKLFGEARSFGYFGDFFHLPLLPDALVPSISVYFALLALELAGGLLAVIGYFGRTGLCLAALAGLYGLLCDRLQYHNNRFALFLVALLTSLTPCDRSFLLFRGRRHALEEHARHGSLWARRLIQLQVSALYLASSTGKLFDPDWRSGQTMLPRFRAALEFLATQNLSPPAFLLDAFAAPWFAELLSRAAIATELFLAFGLFWGRTRVAALWVGVLFHLGIELTSRVELFSFLMGVSYVAFVTPEVRQRVIYFDPTARRARWIARAVRWLDWLARFRLTPDTTRKDGAAVLVSDREGNTLRGAETLVVLARALPVAFPLWPVLWLLTLRPRGASRAKSPSRRS